MMDTPAYRRLYEEFVAASQNRKVCHPARFAHFSQQIDLVLDQFNDWSRNATNWDADMWGLYECKPITSALQDMNKMLGAPKEYWPKEPRMRQKETVQ